MDTTQSVAAPKPSLANNPSPSFRLHNGSLNAVCLLRVLDLFDCNGDGEITVDEQAEALDALGLGVKRSDVPAGASGLRFADFKTLHDELGDALFGAVDKRRT